MNPQLMKAKAVFDGAPVDLGSQCSITAALCQYHTKECDYRVDVVISRISRKIVGWFEGDHIMKTNPKPGKAYMKKNFGMKKEKKHGRRKLFIKTDRPDPDRNEERITRDKRRAEKDKRAGV